MQSPRQNSAELDADGRQRGTALPAHSRETAGDEERRTAPCECFDASVDVYMPALVQRPIRGEVREARARGGCADRTELAGKEPAAPTVRCRSAHGSIHERSVSERFSTRRNGDPRAGGVTDQAEVAADVGSTAGGSRR